MLRRTMADWRDESLAQRFPTSDAVPQGVRIDPATHGPRWLVDGELRLHTAPPRPVLSRVAVRNGDALEPVLIGHEAQLSPEDAAAAVAAASRAWQGGEGPWPCATVQTRSTAVLRFADAIAARCDTIANLLMWEIGKPRASARDEVMRSVEYIRNTVAELDRLRADDMQLQHGEAGGKPHHARTHRRPLGIVLCVAPFNYPVNEFLTTVVPALLMGNVVVAKTPRFGTLANMVLAEAFAECFPRGAVALLPGDGRVVIPAVMSASELDVSGNPEGTIRMLAFIGSEGAANAILRSHPVPITLHKVLGLGAKNAAVVLPDAELDAVAAALVKGALGFNGQRCTAEKLIFAHRSVLEPLVSRLVTKIESLKLGMPWDDGVGITPLPEPTKLESMHALLDDALAHGATIRNTGGGRGWFSLMRPALVAEVTPAMRLFHEEQFGPIVPVAAFDDVEQVFDWQRRSPFGQQAAVWGTPASARPVVRKLTRFVSRVNFNDVCQRGPDAFGFSATDKSGFGTLSLREALLAFSRPVLLQATDEASLDDFRAAPQ